MDRRALEPIWRWGLAVALTVWLQWEAWSPRLQAASGDTWGDDQLLDSLVFLPLTTAVAWRFRAPLRACLVGMTAVTVQALGSDVAPDALSVLTPMMVLLYAASRRSSRLPAMVALAAATVALAANTLNTTVDGDVVGLISGWVLLAAPWFLGRFLRARHDREIELEDRAAMLEREQHALARVAVAEERARIGRELHDVIAHGVSVMGLQAGAAEQVLDAHPERVRQPLEAIQQTARVTLAELRTLLGALRDDSETTKRDPLPGLDRLPDLIEDLAAILSSVRVEVTGNPVALPPGLDVTAYRIVQEALTNVIKHAGSSASVSVQLTYAQGELLIDVTDSGPKGSCPDVDASGHGLLGIRERVAVHHGTFRAGPTAEGGFRVCARLPLP